MDYFVLTSCTQRKRSGLSEPLTVNLLLPGSYAETARSWANLAHHEASKVPANYLYVGRPIKEASTAAAFLNAPLHFISTGFGLIHETTLLPNYDLTVARGHNNLESTITDTPFSPKKWWHAINRVRGSASPLQQLISDHPNAVFLIALSRTYLLMIQEELGAISPSDVPRIRLFTSTDGTRTIPEDILPAWVPYDERFDGHTSPNPGTRSDFPQRVMNHFVHHVLDRRSPNLDTEKQHVLNLLSQYSVRQHPERLRKTDIELIEIIHKHWDQAQGQASKMLRVLRDDLLISCEQKRFAGLFRTAKHQRN